MNLQLDPLLMPTGADEKLQVKVEHGYVNITVYSKWECLDCSLDKKEVVELIGYLVRCLND